MDHADDQAPLLGGGAGVPAGKKGEREGEATMMSCIANLWVVSSTSPGATADVPLQGQHDPRSVDAPSSRAKRADPSGPQAPACWQCRWTRTRSRQEGWC